MAGLWARLKTWEKRYQKSFETPIETEADAKRALFYAEWLDHGFLRHWWTNFDQVAEGVYRSNHPNSKRIAAYADMGIKTILNLRGGGSASLLSDREARRLGLSVANVGMTARAAPRKETIVRLLDAFPKLEKPFLMHCKSGADRTGLAAALYLIEVEGRPVAEARKQLGLRYLHVKASRTGVLDKFLDAYEAAHLASGIGLRDWVTTVYDKDAVNAA